MPSTLGDRSLFPDLSCAVYANHAAIGPLPAPARAAMAEIALEQATHGVEAIAGGMERVAHTRSLLAQLLGVEADELALTGNTSAGIAAIAASTPWQAGDGILLFRGEFPANTTPWQVAARQHDLDLHWVDADALRTDDGLGEVEALLRAHPIRMVAVSAVQFQTGLRMPVEALGSLAHAHGARLFVDAIQALGATPLDLADVDYVAAGGQKWLMGPVGTGLVWARPDAWEALNPTLAGWLSHEDPLAFLWGDAGELLYDRPLQRGPALLEGGGLNLAGLAALGASVALHLERGVEAVHAHANAWNDAVEPTLRTLGFTVERSGDPTRRSCILAARPPEGVHPGAVSSALREHGISVSTPDGRLRFSPSWPNALHEAPRVAAALVEVLQAL